MYMQQWNLSWERQFFVIGRFPFLTWAIEASTFPCLTTSTRRRLRRLPARCAGGTCQGSAANETPRPLLNTHAGGASAPQNPGLIGILDLAFDSGFSTYHGLLASLKHRFRKGFSLNTKLHLFEMHEHWGFQRRPPGTYFQIQNNPRADYAVCNFDITHIFNATVVCSQPIPRKGSSSLLWADGIRTGNSRAERLAH